MKHTKFLGLLAVATAALMAFAGSASATITSPAGTEYDGQVIATSTNTTIDGTVAITCKHAQIIGDIDEGDTTIALSDWTFGSCNRSVSVTAPGHILIESNGTVRSTGARITVQTFFFGVIPVHCIYATNNTKLGTLTEGKDPAIWHIGSAPIPQEATSGACGNDAVMTGNYTVEPPFGEIEVH